MVIRYSQRGAPLGRFGTIVEADTLPQDEATALVTLAALKAQHPSNYPGAFTAVIDDDGDAEPLVLDEDDARVSVAIDAFKGMGRNRSYHAAELAIVRKALIEASTRSRSAR